MHFTGKGYKIDEISTRSSYQCQADVLPWQLPRAGWSAGWKGAEQSARSVLRACSSSRLGICIDHTGDPRHGMPLGVDLESVKPSKRRTIHPQASCAERLLGAAEHVNGNFGRAKFSEQVGKRVENDCRDFELSCELDDLSTGVAGNTCWSAFITLIQRCSAPAALRPPASRGQCTPHRLASGPLS